VAVGPERSASGEPLLAKNLDASSRRLSPYVVRRNKPHEGLTDIDLIDPGMTGCLDGINEAGLTLSCNHRVLSSFRLGSVPPSLLCKELLEGCESVEQAIRQIESWPSIRPTLLLLMDRTGDIATVDFSDRVDVRRTRGMAILTNHGTVETTSSWRRPWGAAESDSSHRRQQRMASLLQHESISLPELKQALADHEDGPGDLSICRHSDHLSTQCSVIFSPQRASMEISRGASCRGSYTQIQQAD
jgi:predicted choloylglycine hydrolase